MFAIWVFILITINKGNCECNTYAEPSCVLFHDEFYNLDNWNISSANVYINFQDQYCPLMNHAPCAYLTSPDNPSISTLNISISHNDYNINNDKITEIGISFDSVSLRASTTLTTIYGYYSCGDTTNNFQIFRQFLSPAYLYGNYFKLPDYCIGKTINIMFRASNTWGNDPNYVYFHLALDNFKLLGTIETIDIPTLKPTSSPVTNNAENDYNLICKCESDVNCNVYSNETENSSSSKQLTNCSSNNNIGYIVVICLLIIIILGCFGAMYWMKWVKGKANNNAVQLVGSVN